MGERPRGGRIGQWASGNHNVQIENVANSSITVTFAGQTRSVPLQPALVPVGRNVSSPARLLRPRSGVLPYTARGGVLSDLEAWAQHEDPFSLCVVGGRGGSGKTRLGVELCEHASAAGWLAGLLVPAADPGALDALVGTPTARLVVVDYAETRAAQLELVLPLLAHAATTECRVRVLLLVRAKPAVGADWTASLRYRSDALDSLLDDAELHVLEELPLTDREREHLFAAAANVLAMRAARDVPPAAPKLLAHTSFASPLMVVIAAYLAVHSDASVPKTAVASA
jgi:hypothetical protein